MFRRARFVPADRSTDLPFLYVPGLVLNYAAISRGHLGRLIVICGRVDRRPASAPPNGVGN